MWLYQESLASLGALVKSEKCGVLGAILTSTLLSSVPQILEALCPALLLCNTGGANHLPPLVLTAEIWESGFKGYQWGGLRLSWFLSGSRRPSVAELENKAQGDSSLILQALPPSSLPALHK